MKVLVAMSGGVDSSVAAALLVEAGHDVVGVTMRLWGGASDTGCCSVADVDDARRVAQQIGIDHLVFNFADDFTADVVDPYVDAHRRGITPNPCIECNRHLKFRRLTDRAALLGFDAVATGHHAQVVTDPTTGVARLARGADRRKDQSYVLHMLTADDLARVVLPVGHLTKQQVREHAARLGLRTATKPDSQDVCFISRAATDGRSGREVFLGGRIPLRPGRVVDRDGHEVGTVPAVELVTLGQRRGLGLPGGHDKRFVVDVDVEAAVVVVGEAADLDVHEQRVVDVTWCTPDDARPQRALVQCSAHGAPLSAQVHVDESVDGDVLRAVVVRWDDPQRRVAVGQSVVLYDPSDTFVIGGGTAV